MSRGSIVRRALRWYLGRGSPWASLSVSVDFTEADRYLERLREAIPEVTVQHLLAAAVGRALGRCPDANRRLVGRRLVAAREVSIAIPVNLLGQPWEGRELSLAFLSPADRMSLREIAEEMGGVVQRERRGEPANPWVRSLIRVGDEIPDPVFDSLLTLLSLLMEIPFFADQFYRRIPISTLLTNLGSVFRGDGERPLVLARGGAFQIPLRPLHFATFWGVGAVQEEAVARGGRVEVRRMLPAVLIFDHRIVDGVKAGSLLYDFAGVLADPARELGDTGDLHPTGPGGSASRGARGTNPPSAGRGAGPPGARGPRG